MQELIKSTFDKYNIECSENVAKDINKFVELMLKYNEIHNLTAITESNDIMYKHILDSVLPYKLLKNNQKIIDIGCGAGFPSVPLSILNSELQFTAIDSVQKKVDFVKMVKDELKLTNLQVFHTRIEDWARESRYREQYDVVVSRAVAPLNVIIEYSAPMLKNGGYIYAYKGQSYETEIESAKNALKVLDCCVEKVEKYYVEEIDTERFVLVIRKNSSISNKYPRTQNKPRIKPL